MTRPVQSEGPDPNFLRRLREFQVRVRQLPRKPAPVVPARGPLSGRDAAILMRLRKLSPTLADSLEQALQDLNDDTRLSYVGPAGEFREVMRGRNPIGCTGRCDQATGLVCGHRTGREA